MQLELYRNKKIVIRQITLVNKSNKKNNLIIFTKHTTSKKGIEYLINTYGYSRKKKVHAMIAQLQFNFK